MIRHIRENWDVAVMVVALGLILGWALFVALLSPLMGQTAPRVIVTWDAINDARLAGYKVKRGITSISMTQATNVGNLTTWLDETIDPSTKYWFSVVGYDSEGREGDVGVAVNNPFRFSDIQPASPANLTVKKVPSTTPGRSAIQANWSPVTKTRSLLMLPEGAVVTYTVFVSNSGTISNHQVIQGTSLTLGGLTKNKTLYVYVFAIWNGIEGLGSPAVRVQT